MYGYWLHCNVGYAVTSAPISPIMLCVYTYNRETYYQIKSLGNGLFGSSACVLVLNGHSSPRDVLPKHCYKKLHFQVKLHVLQYLGWLWDLQYWTLMIKNVYTGQDASCIIYPFWECMDDLNYVSTHWHRRKKGFLKNLIIKYECSSQSKHLSCWLCFQVQKKRDTVHAAVKQNWPQQLNVYRPMMWGKMSSIFIACGSLFPDNQSALCLFLQFLTSKQAR